MSLSQLPIMEGPRRGGAGSPAATPTLEPEVVDLPEPEEPRSPPLVLVVWRDAWSDPDQHSPDDWRHDYPVRTAGFLVRVEPGIVSLAQEILPDGDGYRAVTHIPTAMIESIAPLAYAGSNGNGPREGGTGGA